MSGKSDNADRLQRSGKQQELDDDRVIEESASAARRALPSAKPEAEGRTPISSAAVIDSSGHLRPAGLVLEQGVGIFLCTPACLAARRLACQSPGGRRNFFTSTLIRLGEVLLRKPGGYISNVVMPPGVRLDNIPGIWRPGIARANAAVIDLPTLWQQG